MMTILLIVCNHEIYEANIIYLQFDNKRREVESWLARMDVWLGQMRPVGSTAEMLDVQVREQKVNLNIYFHLCISDRNLMFISNF